MSPVTLGGRSERCNSRLTNSQFANSMEEGESARHQPQEAAGGGREACRHRRAPGYLVSDCEKGRVEKSYGSAAGIADGRCGERVHGLQYQRQRVPAHHGNQLSDRKNLRPACADTRGIQQGSMEKVSTLTISPEYGALLRKVRPKVIRTEKELAELLTLLIEDFEEKRYRLPRGKPLDVLRFLMEQHHLQQKDLADVFGTPSIVSEVLNGKRELNKEQIRRLSARFHVSPELFF